MSVWYTGGRRGRDRRYDNVTLSSLLLPARVKNRWRCHAFKFSDGYKSTMDWCNVYLAPLGLPKYIYLSSPLIFPTTYNGIRTKNRPVWITPGAAPIRWMGPILNPRWKQKRTEGYVHDIFFLSDIFLQVAISRALVSFWRYPYLDQS
jgi:hypothetical protein